MRDLASNLAAVQSIVPAVLAATTTGAAVDLAGFNSAAIVINTGAIVSSGDYTATVEESDASGSGFAAVDDADLVGELPASLAASTVYRIGYIGSCRYLRVVITKNSGTSIAAGAVVVKGSPAAAPVT